MKLLETISNWVNPPLTREDMAILAEAHPKIFYAPGESAASEVLRDGYPIIRNPSNGRIDN